MTLVRATGQVSTCSAAQLKRTEIAFIYINILLYFIYLLTYLFLNFLHKWRSSWTTEKSYRYRLKHSRFIKEIKQVHKLFVLLCVVFWHFNVLRIPA